MAMLRTAPRPGGGIQVYLNVYDLAPANEYLYPIGLGLHHSGVEILGTEYSFASGSGIFEMPPKEAPGARFREQLHLGSFEGSQSALGNALSELRREFGPDDYNLIRKNCNHFANALVLKLLRKRIPPHINRLAEIGMCCSCLLPRSLLESAPVGDSSRRESGLLLKAGSRPMESNKGTVFAGKGTRLGSVDSNDDRQGLLTSWQSPVHNGTGKPAQDDLTDRREKARKAALARLERNHFEGQQQ